MTLTTGSLFSGTGALDMAVNNVLGAQTIWFSDVDPGAVRVLAYHWPDVPNLGDITAIDWSRVARPRIITGGFPCTDISGAGLQEGLIRYGENATRSGLWAHMCQAIDKLRPDLVVAENVRALTSVKADCDVEFCPWCMGDADPESVLRALGAVLGDLADIGYDARWCGLRASDVGAPHGRFRIFIIAWPADSNGERLARAQHPSQGRSASADGAAGRGNPVPDAANVRHERARSARHRRAGSPNGGAVPDPAGSGYPCVDVGTGSAAARDGRERIAGRGDGRTPVSNTSRERRCEGWTEPTGHIGRPDAAERGCVTIPDTYSPTGDGSISNTAGAGLQGTRPEPSWSGSERGDRFDADTERCRCDGWPCGALRCEVNGAALTGNRAVDWGIYEPAVRRWERVLGRPAPNPAAPTSRNGGYQLTGRFDEWLMGMPEGHVTDMAIWAGMTPSAARNAQIKLCGNSVVQRQAEAALIHMLSDWPIPA